MSKLVDTLLISSDDRKSSSTSTTSFVVDLPTTNLPIKKMVIKKVIIPLVYDNITASNKTITIAGSDYDITEGQYNIDTLITELNTLDSGTTTFTYTDQKRITISRSTTFSWSCTTSLAKLLGFANITYSGAAVYTGSQIPSLQPHQYMTLHSNFIASRGNNYYWHSDLRNNTIMFIPVNQDLTTNLVYIPESLIVHNMNITQCAYMDFEIRDSKNVVLDIGTYTIQIVIERYS